MHVLHHLRLLIVHLRSHADEILLDRLNVVQLFRHLADQFIVDLLLLGHGGGSFLGAVALAGAIVDGRSVLSVLHVDMHGGHLLS